MRSRRNASSGPRNGPFPAAGPAVRPPGQAILHHLGVELYKEHQHAEHTPDKSSAPDAGSTDRCPSAPETAAPTPAPRLGQPTLPGAARPGGTGSDDSANSHQP